MLTTMRRAESLVMAAQAAYGLACLVGGVVVIVGYPLVMWLILAVSVA